MIKSFTVQESSWLRGKGGENSYLLDPVDRSRCCLGFLAQQCGLEDNDIQNIPSLGNKRLEPFFNKLPQPLVGKFNGDGTFDSDLAQNIMHWNDNRNITDDERKRRLDTLFTFAGIEIKFEP